jgi:hypothetical protein
MITKVSKGDFFGIINSFTTQEIWLKYGKLVMSDNTKPNYRAIKKLKDR